MNHGVTSMVVMLRDNHHQIDVLVAQLEIPEQSRIWCHIISFLLMHPLSKCIGKSIRFRFEIFLYYFTTFFSLKIVPHSINMVAFHLI